MQTKPRMATDIPASITTPDSVETRLGTLRFFDGFPDDATVRTVYDNLDFQRGVQAFLAALPAADICAVREGYRSFGPDNQTLFITESLMDSRTLYSIANTETVYNVGWLDTKDGPLVIEMPPGVLGFMSDFWSRWVTDVGRVGPDGGAGGRYLLLPPGYAGEVPDGYFEVRSRTYGNAILFRGFMEGGDLRSAVDNTKAHYRAYPLDGAADPPATTFVDLSGKDVNTMPPGDASLFGLVAMVVQEEPLEAADPETRGLLASIGIRKDAPFAPDARMRAILAEAATVGNATARRPIQYAGPGPVPLPGRLVEDAVQGRRRRVLAGRGAGPRRTDVLLRDHVSGHPDDVGEEGGRRLAVCPHGARCCGPVPGRWQELPAPPAASRPGQGLLVADRLRPPDALDAADRPAVPQPEQPDGRPHPQPGHLGGPLLRPSISGRQGEQLGPDGAREGVVRHLAALRPSRALVRPDMAAGGDRAGGLRPAHGTGSRSAIGSTSRTTRKAGASRRRFRIRHYLLMVSPIQLARPTGRRAVAFGLGSLAGAAVQGVEPASASLDRISETGCLMPEEGTFSQQRFHGTANGLSVLRGGGYRQHDFLQPMP